MNHDINVHYIQVEVIVSDGYTEKFLGILDIFEKMSAHTDRHAGSYSEVMTDIQKCNYTHPKKKRFMNCCAM